MSLTLGPLRSVLYMPGSNDRALTKAPTLPCDAVILDLEDAVAPDAKDSARALVRSTLDTGGFGYRTVVVRINSLDGPWGQDDLAAFTASPVDALLLPKVESPEQLLKLALAMTKRGYDDRTAIWAMMETPRGILDVAPIARGTPRLQCLVMGTNDLAKDLRIAPTAGREAFQTSFGLTILAARANDLAVLDGVFTDLNDEAGLIAECQQGKSLGFDGKTLIHPKQIDAANKTFRPGQNEIQQAKRMLETWKEAEAKGQAVATLDGKMIEQLHVNEAKRLIALDEAIRDRMAIS